MPNLLPYVDTSFVVCLFLIYRRTIYKSLQNVRFIQRQSAAMVFIWSIGNMLWQQPVRAQQWRCNSKLHTETKVHASCRQIRYHYALCIVEIIIVFIDVGIGFDCLRGHCHWSSTEHLGRR